MECINCRDLTFTKRAQWVQYCDDLHSMHQLQAFLQEIRDDIPLSLFKRVEDCMRPTDLFYSCESCIKSKMSKITSLMDDIPLCLLK